MEHVLVEREMNNLKKMKKKMIRGFKIQRRLAFVSKWLTNSVVENELLAIRFKAAKL